MKNSPTAASARISRERSSSRCEISVPSESFSGSSLMGCRVWGGGVCGGGRLRGRRCYRWRRRARGIYDRPLHVLGFLFELVAKLAGHRARIAEPPADQSRHLRQLVRAQHDERDHKNDQELRKAALEHGGCLMTL